MILKPGNAVMGKPQMNNFFLRSITAIIVAPIILFNVHLGGYVYKGLIVMMAILMAFEWQQITYDKNANLQKNILWKIIGIMYILLPTLSLIWLREHAKGREIIFWLLANIWATDIAAYIFGNLIGGWKICPKISPNKSWSGFVGGVCAAFVVGYVTTKLMHSNKPQYIMILSVVLSIYGQIGDLIESWMKRYFHVKDSGKIIPGHGGILDRVDSLVPVAPKVVMVLLFDKWGIF
jgi:phosphatidate cytidylyltransferase